MKSYKDLEHLKETCILNNGEKVFVWDDEGIRINGVRFKMFEYGDMDGHSYVTFKHDEDFISIEYKLLFNEEKKTNNIFKFILIRECW